MSRIATSGLRRLAASTADGPSCATCVSWPSRVSSSASVSAASTLSSTTRIRRGGGGTRSEACVARRSGGVLGRARDAEREDAALAFALARGGQAAAVQLGEALGEREADPEPSVDRLVRPVPLPEHREDVREVHRRDADAGIHDRDDDVSAVARRPRDGSARPARCTWPRSRRGSQRPARAASDRRAGTPAPRAGAARTSGGGGRGEARQSRARSR